MLAFEGEARVVRPRGGCRQVSPHVLSRVVFRACGVSRGKVPGVHIFPSRFPESHGACGIKAGVQSSSLLVGVHLFMRPGGGVDEM